MTADIMAPLYWQHEIWQKLCERKESDRLPHAILLHGVEGIGKGHMARLLAVYLLCRKPQQNLPCMSCASCDLFKAGTHPDFFHAHPAYGEGESEDDLSEKKTRKVLKKSVSKQIKMDCIRDLIYFGSHMAHQGGARVAIVEPAEALNRNAANALLKTLEEPGQNQFIILVSQQASLLLPTLRSRCQMLFCPAPNMDEAKKWLRAYTTAERAEESLQLCAGAPLRALQAIADNEDLNYRRFLEILSSTREERMNYIGAAEALDKLDAGKVFGWWEVLSYEQCKKTPQKKLFQFVNTLEVAHKKVRSVANPNTRSLFEVLLIDWLTLTSSNSH